MEQSTIQELLSGLRAILQDKLVQIILYGSVARGTNQEDSDIDVALLVRDELDADMADHLSDFIVDMNLKYDKGFSVIDINAERFSAWKNDLPFYRQVSQEGIVLWQAA